MPIDISRNIDRHEAGDTFQFTLSTTGGSRPDTVAFVVFNTDGSTLALEAVQSGATVAESGASTGLFHFERVLPSSVGLYFAEWSAWDAASRPYVNRFEFEVIRTGAHSFFTYADVTDTVRTARQIFGRGDITLRDVRPYLEAGDGWIDAWLGRITTVPLGSSSPLVRDMSKVYGLYYYYADRYSVEKEDAPPAIVGRKDRYDDLLEAIVAGSASIGTITVEDEITVLPGAGEFKGVFDMRDPISQRVDPDLIEAEDSADD